LGKRLVFTDWKKEGLSGKGGSWSQVANENKGKSTGYKSRASPSRLGSPLELGKGEKSVTILEVSCLAELRVRLRSGRGDRAEKGLPLVTQHGGLPQVGLGGKLKNE